MALLNRQSLLEIRLARLESTPPEELAQLARQSRVLRRLVVCNPSAPGELLRELEKLSDHNDERTRRAIASHPNSPPDLLIELAEDFPAEFLANPALSLFDIEAPGIFLRLPERSLLALAACSGTPPDLLKLLASVAESRMGKPVPGREREALEKIAKHPNLPPGTLESFAAHDENWLRAAAAANPSMPPELLVQLARDDELQVCRSVAGNPATPIHVLERFFYHEGKKHRLKPIYIDLARNPSTPEKILNNLLTMSRFHRNPVKFDDMMWAILENPAMPTRAAMISKRCRAVLLRRSTTPLQLLEELWHFQELRGNDNTAGFDDSGVPESWQVIEKSKSLGVYESLLANPACPEEAFRYALSADTPLAQAMSEKSGLAGNLLALLAEHHDEQVRTNVAENPSTPQGVLNRLVEDPAWRVREALARSPSTPPETLARLSRDPDTQVLRVVVENPHLPLDALSAVVTIFD